MKKLVNLIALVMLVSTNVLTPFSYAQVETPELIPENEVENIEEIGETPEKDNEITGEIPNSLGEVEGEGSLPLVREVVNESEPEGLKEEVEDSIDDVESPTIGENKDEGTEKSETDEVAQQEEENTKIEKQEEKLEGDEVEEDSSLQKVEEPAIMEEIGTSATLLPGQEFNATIKTLAHGGRVPYTVFDEKIQSFQRVNEIPTGVITGEISIIGAEYPVYAGFSGGILYYATESETIYMNPDSSYMFYGMDGLTGIDLSSFNTSKVTNMSYMFSHCVRLVGLDLSSFDTSNVTDMSYMFEESSNLENLNMSSFDTSRVTDMQHMFKYYKGTSLDLSNFDTSRVTNMDQIFGGCYKLENLNLSGWDFSHYSFSNYGGRGMIHSFFTSAPSQLKSINMTNAKFSGDMSYLFRDLIELEELKLDGVDTKNVIDMSFMFWHCEKLTGLNLESFNTSNVVNMNGMFNNCHSLTGLDVSNFDTSKVTQMQYMFAGCSSLKNLNLDGWDLAKVTLIADMFGGVDSLEKLSARNWIIPEKPAIVTLGCENSKLCADNIEIDVSGWDLSNARDLSRLFASSKAKEIKGLDTWNTSNITGMYYMFGGCSNLTGLDLSNFDTSNVLNMQTMFFGDSNLKELDLSNWNMSKVTNIGAMFYGCSGLNSLNMNNRDLNNVTNRGDMFNGCSELENISIDNRNVSKGVGIGRSMFSGLPKLKKMSARNWKIPISFADWLGRTRGLRKLEEIDVSNWDLAETKDLLGLFADVENLKTIKGLDTWDTSGVQNMGQMFQGCTGLTGLDLSNFDTSKVTNMYMMFDRCDNLEVLNLSGWDFREYGSDSLSRNLLNVGYNHPLMKRLNLTNAKFSGSMNGAFEWLSLEEIKLDGVDTTNVTSMNSMFHSNGTNKIKNLDLSSFDTSQVTDMGGMFNGCEVENLNLSGWDFRKYDVSGLLYHLFPSGTNGSEMKLKNLNLTNAKFSGSMNQAFYSHGNSQTLEQIILSGVNTSGVTDMSSMFLDQKLLTSLDLSSLDTSNVTNMSAMFNGCNSLTGLDLSSFDTSNVTNVSQMFGNCSSLTGLNLSNWDTSNVTNMGAIFYGCNNLEELNLSGWDFRKYSNASLMMNITAGRIPVLKKLNMSNTKYTGIAANAFGSLNNLEELNLDGADVSDVTNMSAMFYGDNNLKILNLSGLDTSNVENMSAMFNGCSSLTGLDLSSFDTIKVKNMNSMFYNTPNLKTIYASDKFVTDNVTSHGDMFTNDIALVGGNGTKFDSGYIDKTYAKIDKVGQTGYFTDKNAINVKFINTLDGTETTSTFAKGQKLTPPYVDKYHVVGGYLDEEMTQAIDLNKGVDTYTVIYVKYDRNGSSGGGGGGGSSKKTDEDTHGSAEDSQKNTQDDKNTENVIQSDPEYSEWGSEESSNTPIDSSDKSSEGQEILSPSDSSFTKEQKDAYQFAKENGITTKDTIQSAQMNGKLTRIAMAKMLSQYAINVLGQTPDTSKTVKFKDVSNKKDADYDNGVTLAYQLGIMGQNMPNNRFRPNDEVSRAEFATALSRLLYKTTDGEYKSTREYYIPHMAKLYNEGIISNTDPSMAERRGYVMIMLMRSAK